MSIVQYSTGGTGVGLPAPTGKVSLRDELELWGEAMRFADAIANTEFVPKAIRGNSPAVLATMLRAHELGVSALHGLASIHFIEGRPSLSAELMRALVLEAGHEMWTEEATATRVVMHGQRSGSSHITKVVWTTDMAKQAGLIGKTNWRSYPRAMLAARATAELCRLAFADVIAGLPCREEVEDGFDFEDSGEEVPAPTKTQKRSTTRRTTKGTASAPTGAATGDSNVVPIAPEPPLPGEEETAAPSQGSAVPPDVSGGEGGTPARGATAAPAPSITSEPDAVVTSRAQQIGMKAADIGIDHHHVVSAITKGRKTSAKDVTAAEGSAVLLALVDIKAGKRMLLDFSGESGTPDWRLLTPAELDDEVAVEGETEQPPVPPSAVGEPAPHEWPGSQWRDLAAKKKVKITVLLSKAQQLAREDGDPPPATLDDLGGRESLCAVLLSWIESGAK